MSNVAIRPSARFETIGITSGAGVTITAAGSVGVKGSYSDIGTTGFAYDGFLVHIRGATARRAYHLDVAIGSTPDLIITDLAVETPSNLVPIVIDFPIKVPAGVVMKMRTAASNAGTTFVGSIIGYAYDHRGMHSFSRAEQLASLSSGRPSNTVTETGTSFTAWTEIDASTARRYNGLILCSGAGNDGTRTAADLVMEVGRGSSGAEQTIAAIPGTNASLAMPIMPFFLPVDLPEGTRLAYRVQCSDGAAADTFACAAMGLW